MTTLLQFALGSASILSFGVMCFHSGRRCECLRSSRRLQIQAQEHANDMLELRAAWDAQRHFDGKKAVSFALSKYKLGCEHGQAIKN